MTDDENTESSALTLIMTALRWAYDRAESGFSELFSASRMAEDALNRYNGSVENAIDSVINWDIAKSGAAGFITNLGGIMTLPVSIPANLASTLFIQIRMIQAIAILRGYDTKSEQVRSFVFLCLVGSSISDIIQEVGVAVSTKVASQIIMKVPGRLLIEINKSVGFRLITKAGATGVVNLSKIVPFIGGVVGGAFDSYVTSQIGSAARAMFAQLPSPVPDDRYAG